MKKAKQTESGQAILEYILLLSILMGSVVYMRNEIYSRLDRMVLSMGARLGSQLQSGKMNGIWAER